jgi:nitrogen fixation protein FixH
MAATTNAEAWKNFPRYLIAAMLFVMLVNARFIYVAVTTFPGEASSNDFDTNNRYDKIMVAVEAQNALGWSETAGVQGLAAFVDLTGPDHQKLAGAVLTGTAERPIGTDAPVAMAFHETAPGHYVADRALPMPGQWDLKLRIAQGGHNALVTRRIVTR